MDKICTKCKEIKAPDKFGPRKDSKDGLQSQCRMCIRIRTEKYCENNPEKVSKHKQIWYEENKKVQNQKAKENYYLDKKNRCKKQKEYYKKKKEERLEYAEKYRKDNKNEINVKKKERHNDRYKNEIQYKLAYLLRTRISSAIKGNYKVGSAVRDLGCSIKDLKIHLEEQFLEGMTWENHGLYGWHIDHKLALANVDLTDREQFLKVCNFSNLQPLWAKDNLSKGCKEILC